MRAKRIGEILGWGLLLGTLTALGWALIAVSFMVYDDEGYVLLSVRQFCDGKPLYTEVFSQYGPAFFLFYRGLHVLTGVIYDHEVGRLLTLGYWVATAGMAGWMTRRLTDSVIAGWSSAILGFIALSPNINEPFHPGSLLALLCMGAACAGAECLLRGQHRRMAFILGLIGALVVLIKINVGVFLLCAWGGWWIAHELKGGRWGRGAGWLVSMGVVLLPLLLMRSHLGETWALGFAWVFMASALGVWSQVWLCQTNEGKPAGWTWIGLAGAVVTATVISMAWLGTSPAALWEGSLIAPLRHPQVYAFPAKTTLWLGGAAWVSLGVFQWIVRRTAAWRSWLIIAVRAAGLAGYCWQARDPIDNGGLWVYAFIQGPLLAVWMLTPLENCSSFQAKARWWLAWVFLWQLLQAYPVAGSQVAWGSTLWVVIASIGCVDTWRHLARRWRPAAETGALLWAGTALGATGVVLVSVQAWWADSARLELPGARWLRPPPDVAHTLQAIQVNLQRDAGCVFSVPGLMSFNLWSGQPTPTAANATHWFSLLNDRQMMEIMTTLEQDPRAMLVVQTDLLRFLYRKGFAPTGPLSDYVRTAFVPAIRLGDYDLCVKRGRQIAAYNTFRLEYGRLIARVIREDGPAPVWLRDPARPGWGGVLLKSAVWTQQDKQVWQLDALLPLGWPPSVRREMVIGETSPQIIPENTLPNAPAMILK